MGKRLFASGRFWNGPLVVTAHVPAPELQEQRVALLRNDLRPYMDAPFCQTISCASGSQEEIAAIHPALRLRHEAAGPDGIY
jgi:hypothetical protein